VIVVTVKVDSRFFLSHGPLTIADIVSVIEADIVDKTFEDETVSAGAALETSRPGDITFFESRKHKDALKTAKATACFVAEKDSALVGEHGIIPIISAFPRTHFARTLERLYSPLKPISGPAEVSPTARIHNSVIIGAGAVISEGVDIAPYVVIGPGVLIGKHTQIGANVSLSSCLIGENCRIKAGAVIGEAGFGVAHDESGIIDIPHIGRVIIGDRVSIGSQTCVDRGQLGDTEIGVDTKIDNFVQIAHNVQIGPRCAIAGHVGISGSCHVGSDVMMGGNVGLADHITIGDGARLAARAGVMHSVPAGETWSGIPAQPIRDHMRMVSAMRKLTVKPKRDQKA